MRRFLAFELDGRAYAVDVGRVEVVLEPVPITRVPRAAEHLRGVINYRGAVVPVADLRVRFGEGPSDLAAMRSLVVLQVQQGGDSLTIAVLADSVREVVDVAATRLERAPRMGRGRLDTMVEGVYESEGDFVVVLDIDRVFDEQEVEA